MDGRAISKLFRLYIKIKRIGDAIVRIYRKCVRFIDSSFYKYFQASMILYEDILE